MKNSILIATALLLTSCVTSGDLFTLAENLAKVEKNAEETQQAIVAVAEDVEERTFDWAEAAAAMLGTVITGAGLSVPVVNHVRDSRRKARGEATGKGQVGVS